MVDLIKEKYFQREIKPKADSYIVRIPIHQSSFFTNNKSLPQPAPPKMAEANPSFLEKYIQDETAKLPAYILRKIAREKKNDLL